MSIQRGEWWTIIRASLGGALEFYDFVIYGIFAQYIGKQFFPSQDEVVSLMLSLAVFATGYLARPLGGVILSHFGDKYGRRRIFIMTILGMSCATTCMGLLPGFATLGYAAPALMILLRLIQGMCLGGELPGAITYVVETVPRQANFVGGVIFFCVNTGVGLGSVLSLVINNTLDPAQVAEWGWRIGFLFGGACGLLSFWLRLSLEETGSFKKLSHGTTKVPVAEVVRDFPAQVVVGVAALAASGGFNGLLFTAPAYFAQVMHYPAKEVIGAENIGLAVGSVGLLTVSWLGDRMPRRRLLALGGFLLMALGYPFYSAAESRSVDLSLLFVGAGLVCSFFHGTFMGVAADLFPTRIRFSGVALILNISFTTFSGLAPLAATLLARETGSLTGPAWFTGLCGLLTLAAGLVLKRYDGQIQKELALGPVPAGPDVALEPNAQASTSS